MILLPQRHRMFSCSGEHCQGALTACGDSALAQLVLAADGGGRPWTQDRDGSQALGLRWPSGWCRVVLAPAAPPAGGTRPHTVPV